VAEGNVGGVWGGGVGWGGGGWGGVRGQADEKEKQGRVPAVGRAEQSRRPEKEEMVPM